MCVCGGGAHALGPALPYIASGSILKYFTYVYSEFKSGNKPNHICPLILHIFVSILMQYSSNINGAKLARHTL